MTIVPMYSVAPAGLFIAVRTHALVVSVLRSVLPCALPLEQAVRQVRDLPQLLVDQGAAVSGSYENRMAMGARWRSVDDLLAGPHESTGPGTWRIEVRVPSGMRDIAAEKAWSVFGRIVSSMVRDPFNAGMRVEFPHGQSVSVPLVCAGLASLDAALKAEIAQAAA